MKRRLYWLLALTLGLCLCACGKKETARELVLKAPEGVRVVLMAGFEGEVTVSPARTYQEDGFTYYCYTGLQGACRSVATGLGYYSTTQNIVVNENLPQTPVDVTPEKRAGTGWEPESVQMFADALRTGAFSDDLSQWPGYKDVFTTPWFTQSHARHQITTQTQLEDYLKSLNDQQDDLYLYSIGASNIYRQDIPMAVLTKTDLSGAATLEDMAKALQNGKPTVLYRAHIHGVEPASGEAALAVISLLDNRWNKYLEQMNVCIIPRSAPDSAQNFTRYVGGTIEPNQDCLRLKTAEVEHFVKVSRLLLPEVVIDGHEYQCHVPDAMVEGGDILVGLGYTVENAPDFRKVELEIAEKIFATTKENGLSSRYYTDVVSTGNNANGARSYAANMGSLFFLHESRGIGMGTDLYPRRIISHVTAVEGLLGYIYENPQKIIDTVAAERADIIQKGSVYSEDQRLPIEIKSRPNESLAHGAKTYDQLTGQAVEVTVIPKEMDDVVRSVPAPTAYVIPAGASFTDQVLKRLDQQGIAYTFIPKGSKVFLQQYSETGLLEETAVTFPKGAYAVCRNQVQGRNLYHLMEPEIPNHGQTKGTLVAQGVIAPENGVYPIYRYIHDLNKAGMLDYKT